MGVREGDGELHLKDGNIIKGNWKNGKLIKGALIKNGEIIKKL